MRLRVSGKAETPKLRGLSQIEFKSLPDAGYCMARAKRHRRVPAELREASGGLMQPSWETLAQDPGGGGGGEAGGGVVL